jgi:superfamily II DNA or RNA helicase
MASFRPYQQHAFDAIVHELQNNNKCIVKMFCGSGKSLIMHNIVKHFDLQSSVFVFPSLSLVDQFYTDYLKKSSSTLKISSDAESTTEIDVITKFINNKKITKKIICITYQSFNLLLNNLQGNKIDVCCFDEAHHAVGNTYQKLNFNDDDAISKQIFFTATPKNANGRNDLSKSTCGNLVYDYSYLQGVNEGFLNPFEIRVDLFTENTNKSIYESIARAILTTGNSRVLTFHSNVNSESDSSIINFVDEKVKTEFPTKKGFYKKICMIGLDAKTIMVNRREILKKFKKGSNDDTEHNITVL